MALVYFDSSALVKLVIEEPGSELAAALWDGADSVITSAIAYPEVRAALAAARRDNRMDDPAYRIAKRDWQRYWRGLRIVLATTDLLVSAGAIAERYDLRGYDAVHLASGLILDDPSAVVATWDKRLRVGVTAAGLSLAPGRG